MNVAADAARSGGDDLEFQHWFVPGQAFRAVLGEPPQSTLESPESRSTDVTIVHPTDRIEQVTRRFAPFDIDLHRVVVKAIGQHVQYTFGQFAVIGEQHQALTVGIKPPHRIQSLGQVHQIADRAAALRVASSLRPKISERSKRKKRFCAHLARSMRTICQGETSITQRGGSSRLKMWAVMTAS